MEQFAIESCHIVAFKYFLIRNCCVCVCVVTILCAIFCMLIRALLKISIS